MYPVCDPMGYPVNKRVGLDKERIKSRLGGACIIHLLIKERGCLAKGQAARACQGGHDVARTCGHQGL